MKGVATIIIHNSDGKVIEFSSKNMKIAIAYTFSEEKLSKYFGYRIFPYDIIIHNKNSKFWNRYCKYIFVERSLNKKRSQHIIKLCEQLLCDQCKRIEIIQKLSSNHSDYETVTQLLAEYNNPKNYELFLEDDSNRRE